MATQDIHPDAVQAVIHGDHGAPFDLLGPHRIDDKTVSVRAFRPAARTLHLLERGKGGPRLEMQRLHEAGFFELTLEQSGADWAYEYAETTHDGQKHRFADPYAFGPLLTDFDMYLFAEGRYRYSYDKLGAHLREVNGVQGVNFAVWAPNAHRVSVIGDFNGWDSRVHPLRLHGSSGIWELFVPGLKAGDKYKYELLSRYNNYRTEKSDPYGFYAEQRPLTASVVADLAAYRWGDGAWMQQRAARDPLRQPMTIYEVHMGSWRRKDGDAWLTYRELADELVPYLQGMGYTHVELMPISEHPLDMSWGYQVTGYYAPTSRFGSPQDFMYFVDTCHQHGIGVILDWVPAHFPKDGHALSYFDGTHLYEHADLRQGQHPDWGTYIFNYGRSEVRNFLISNALFWLKVYHIDGLRVDAVSSMVYLDFSRKDGEWVPNKYGGNENLEAVQFLQEFNAVVHEECPGVVTIAEESTAWPMVSRPTYLGGLGFTLKWNMGWMHDTLDYMQKDPVYRRWAHNQVTFSLAYAFSENFVLSLSHDEVVHGKGSLINKMAGDWWQKFATLRACYALQATHPGKKLLFMGQEIGQWQEWSEARSLDWHLLEFPMHRMLQDWVRELNMLVQSQPSLYEMDFEPDGFRWIEANDADQSIFTYLRFARDRRDFLLVVLNFTPMPRYEYRIGAPQPGYYHELLNSDAGVYGGGNIGNLGRVESVAWPWHGWPQSIALTVPPLAAVILKHEAT